MNLKETLQSDYYTLKDLTKRYNITRQAFYKILENDKSLQNNKKYILNVVYYKKDFIHSWEKGKIIKRKVY